MPELQTKTREPENMWKRLTRLFRSGPVVRHKIAAGEKLNEPRGTARAYKKELSSLYVHSLASYGQYERLARYADYSEMEFTPEIASALDIYGDEVTSFDEHGQTIKIVSKNQEIKQTLETLFFDILNFEFNAWSWTRNLCKYGDFVLFVDASESNGILNLLPIPINEIEREEGYDKEDPFAVRFRWLTQGNMILENWQVIHFRLLGNDNFLPYGASIIEPARRIWRQLILIEDAMLVYRIVRSPERRVFYIDVGNVAPADIESFMEQIKTRLRRTQVVDPTTGRVDLRYNPLSVDEDYFIPTRGDKSSKIETLAGGQFTGDIDDVQYIQNKLFAALKIPKSYLGYEGEIGSKATLAQQDVRFARTIERIQKIIISELNKIAIIHLFLLGYSGEDLVDFEIKMANPSSIALQQKLELWRTKFEIAGTATEGMLDRKTVYKKIFDLSDDEIEAVMEGKRADKLEDLTLEAMQLPTENQPPGGGAGGETPPEGGEETPGEGELPTTLGGEPGGGAEEAPPTEGVAGTPYRTSPSDLSGEEEKEVLPEKKDKGWGLECMTCGHSYPWNKGFNPAQATCCQNPRVGFKKLEPQDEKKNKGSEGNDAMMSTGKGHDLFNPSTNLHTHVFGRKKQTASDPNDMRAFKRLINRPFSDSIARQIGKRVYLSEDERSESVIDRKLKDSIQRTKEIDETIRRTMDQARELDKKK
jgi:hypothetical protein